MKKLSLVLAAGILTTSVSVAGPGDPKEPKPAKSNIANQVTYFSMRSFQENFGNINDVVWESSPEFDRAAFMKDGKPINAYFTKDGEFIGTTFDVNFSGLPMSAQKSIIKKYGADAIVKVFEFDDNEESSAAMYIEGTLAEDNDNYFVVVKDPDQTDTILQVSMTGGVSFFKKVDASIAK